MGPDDQLTHDVLRSSDDAIFLVIREALRELGYSEETLRSRYFFRGNPGDLLVYPRASQKAAETLSALDVLVHLFLGQEALPGELAAECLGLELLAALRAADLIRIAEDGLCRASVRLEPVEDLLVCADLVATDLPRRLDCVYRPWDYSAQSYTRMVPLTQCESFLEMCCGSAYVCLRAARSFAELTCGVDINARAIYFGEFNKKLNGIETVELRCGDLFAPVASRTFDRIVAHPPYIPATRQSFIYKDGGADGEEISSRLIRALPQHLAEGGSFHGYVLLSDRREAPAEVRVREMLGMREQDFDIALLTQLEETPMAFFGQRPDANFFSENNAYLREMASRLEITRFVKGVLTIQPRKNRTAVTLRHRAMGWETVMRMAVEIA